MLSRVADAAYWLSRYIERTKMESTLLVTNYIAIQDNSIESNWRLILNKYGDKKSEQINEFNSSSALIYLIAEKNNPYSIINNIMFARENARSIQDHITIELWQALNSFYLTVQSDEYYKSINNFIEPIDSIYFIRNQCYLFDGVLKNTMHEGTCNKFMNIGKYLERILQILDILTIKLEEINGDFNEKNTVSFRYLLNALSGFEYFWKTYRGDITPKNIIEYVLFDKSFSHSVFYSLISLEANLKALKDESTEQAFSQIQFEIGKVISNYTYSNLQINNSITVLAFIKLLNAQIVELSEKIKKGYFE